MSDELSLFGHKLGSELPSLKMKPCSSHPSRASLKDTPVPQLQGFHEQDRQVYVDSWHRFQDQEVLSLCFKFVANSHILCIIHSSLCNFQMSIMCRKNVSINTVTYVHWQGCTWMEKASKMPLISELHNLLSPDKDQRQNQGRLSIELLLHEEAGVSEVVFSLSTLETSRRLV